MVPDDLIDLVGVDRVWIEKHTDPDVCDVLVRMDDGAIYTATFVTFAYLHRQMELTRELTSLIDETVPVPFTTLDTPHVIMESLERDLIEDTIDNLLALETFGSVFTRVTEDEQETDQPIPTTGTRATQEVAAVVLTDVLRVQE